MSKVDIEGRGVQVLHVLDCFVQLIRVTSTTRECKNPYPKCGVLNRNVSKHYLYQDEVIPTSCLACSGLEWLQRQGKMRTCHF